MAMKKIKPQYGKVVAPQIESLESSNGSEIESKKITTANVADEKLKPTNSKAEMTEPAEKETLPTEGKTNSSVIDDPNPFLQTKEIFGKARLTKIGYRMRSDYVEILDIIKKIKKNGYTLEAVLDDALTYYFENSEDGKQALEKAALFYS